MMKLDVTLPDRIKEYVSSTSEWRAKVEAILQRRLGWRPREKLYPFKGAANYVDPIVDDNVRERTDQDLTVMFNVPRMAHAVPLEKVEAEDRVKMETGFDSYLRYIINPRDKVEEAYDTKNAIGGTIFKNVRAYNELLDDTIPDIEIVDPLALVVPLDTKKLEDSELIAEVKFLSPDAFKRVASEKEWSMDKVDNIIRLYQSADRRNELDLKDTFECVKDMMGVQSADVDEYICIVEAYHYANELDTQLFPGSGLIEGRKMVTFYCPDAPYDNDHILEKFPWREQDTFVALQPEETALELVAAGTEGREPETTREEIGRDREWPYTQGRFEIRDRYYYGARGLGHLLMDDQIEATGVRNAHANIRDFVQTPLFTGPNKNASNISFTPGTVIPKDIKPVPMQTVPPQLQFDRNTIQAGASRRAGSSGLHNFSENIGAKTAEKTAREIDSSDSRANRVSSSSVDRVNDPLMRVYRLMYKDMKRMRLEFPIINVQGSLNGALFSADMYEIRVLLVPASTAKHLDPEAQIRTQSSIIEFMMRLVPQGLPFDVIKAARSLLSEYDDRLTHGWIPDENSPEITQIASLLEQMKAQIEGLVQAGSTLQGAVQEVAKDVDELHDDQQKLQDTVLNDSFTSV